MDLQNFLKAGVKLAGALEHLHRENIIHQNITPEIIRIDPGSGEAELHRSAPPVSIRRGGAGRDTGLRVAALPYMSPEQTGRVSRPIDQRSDLYSLGIVLYEMLARIRPFSAEDALGWVHCHLAVPPQPLVEAAPSTPRVVSEIIMKLIAKAPEDRYQTAQGLMLDLERCLAELNAAGEIPAFTIASRDLSDKLQIPAKLYGREDEISALFAAFERVVDTGTPGIALVSGYSGIGKSSLVQELQKPIVRTRGFFLAGKFDQYKRDIPYFTVGQAFRELIRQILGESEERLNAWKESLGEALGKNGQLIIDVIPQLELVIGEQPEVAPLPSNEAQIRMNATFQSFIGVFAKQEHPLALFLDDLQWADLASLNLLHHLLTNHETRHLFILGAYRDNEVSASHPLVTAIAELRQARARITELTLWPLSRAHLNELVADTLRCSPEEAQPLSSLLYTKTGGNPFFVTQFLLELYQQKLLVLDLEERAWKADLAGIEAKSYTDNVVELIVRKLKRLPGEARDTLKLAACVGNEFELGVVAVIVGKDIEATRASLEYAIADGLLLERAGACKFLHDRVQQAAYTLIPEEQRGEVHLRIGRLLWENTPERDREERVFEIVNQMNLGASMITEPAEKRRVAELNLRAGKKAKASSAHKSASAYLSVGLGVLTEESWETDYALAYAIHKELAECEIQNGRLDEAERLGVIAQAHVRDKIEKAATYQLRMQVRTTKAAYDEGIELGIECLKLFGVELSSDPSAEEVAAAIKAVDESLRSRAVEELLELPLVTDPAVDAVMNTLALMYISLAFTARAKLTDLVICRMVSTSIEHGNTAPSCLGYAVFGGNITLIAGDYRMAYRLAKLAYDLVEKHQFVSYKCQTCNILDAMVSHWNRHLRDNLLYSREGVRAGLETGNALYTCLNSVQGMMASFLKGDTLEQLRAECAASMDLLQSTKLLFVVDLVVAIQRLILDMAGLTENFSSWSGDGFDEVEYDKNMRATGIPIVRFWCHTTRAISWFLSGDYRQAFEEGKLGKELSSSAPYMMPVAEVHFFTALAAAALWNDAGDEQRRELREIFSEHERRLQGWAEGCADNYLGKHALLRAEIARVEGRDLEAARLYDDAIRSFRGSGFVQLEGIANELAARFYMTRNFLTIPEAYLREAVSCFTRWGAEGKVRQLKWLYPEILGHERQAPELKEQSTQAEQLDTVTAVKASKALSRETVPDKLLASLMRILVEHASAQRCCLLLPIEGRMSVVAEATIDPRGIDVQMAGAGATIAGSEVPITLVNYAKRTREKVLINDASQGEEANSDEYLAAARPKSVLCIPIVRHGEIEGILYLENKLVAGAFTPRRLALLEFLAAVSLENATLSAELEKQDAVRKRAEKTLSASEERLHRLMESGDLIPWEAGSATDRFTYMGARMAALLGRSQDAWQEQPAADFLRAHVHPDDRDEAIRRFFDPESRSDRFDLRMIAADGRAISLHSVICTAPLDDGSTAYSGFLIDITERKDLEARLKEQSETIQRQQEVIRSMSPSA